jgi:RsiW-degrading membrane proteinase PrsW (M82 family)
MPMRVKCTCGAMLNVPDSVAGKTIRCPRCGGALLAAPAPAGQAAPGVPSPDAPAPASSQGLAAPLRAPVSDDADYNVRPLAPVASSVPAAASPAAATAALAGAHPPSVWRRRHLFFALTLVPLFLWLFAPNDPKDVERRLIETLDGMDESSREKAIAAANSTKEDPHKEKSFFAALPNGRIRGALLARSSAAHWFFAFLAAAGFMTALLLLFPRGEPPGRLILVALFTGTLGILLLLGVQWIALHTAGIWVTGHGILTLVFYIVKFIGFSYRSALDPENGFLLSFLGFTCGVGFCEELCKALPLIRLYRKNIPHTWRRACLWGLASGIGFGVSEGITYSSDFYNGILPGSVYCIRFISCVGLHAAWAAAAALLIHRWQEHFDPRLGWQSSILPTLKVLAVPMVLHGLYDTLLKKDMEVWAFTCALLSFGFLALLIEWMHRQDAAEGIKQLAAARLAVQTGGN